MQDIYLSVVATARNDDHGKDMLKRMSCFISSLQHQSNRTKLHTELIVVDWNTPNDKPDLSEVLQKPQDGGYLSVRYVIVPPEVHNQYYFAQKLSLYQMIAKNVGIRRAKGKFVLCTNIDIIFSNECFDYIAEKKLRQDYFYRANRCDIPAEVMNKPTEEERLMYASKNILKRFGNVYWLRFVGWLPSFMFGFKNTVRLLDAMIGLLAKPFSPQPEDFVFLDTHACGDFTLMSKEAWIDIQGYPEVDMYSIHIDSMGIYAAIAAGYKQEIFKPAACIYHIFHEDGWDSHKTPVELLKFACERPCLDWNTVFDASKYIYEHKQRWNINKDNWGFADITFTEKSFN